MLEIKQGQKSFYIGDAEDSPLAEMTYVLTGENYIIVDHTNVSEKLKGQGVGKLLLDELVNWVRKENKKIIPLCPFVKAQMQKGEEYWDVLR
jgi:predicted GNAT family acetyltransferase